MSKLDLLKVFTRILKQLELQQTQITQLSNIKEIVLNSQSEIKTAVLKQQEDNLSKIMLKLNAFEKTNVDLIKVNKQTLEIHNNTNQL